MSRIAAMGNEVIFVEPSQSFGILASRRRRINPIFGYRCRSEENGIRILTPPLALPFRHSGLGKYLNHKRWSGFIRREVARLNRTVIDILWVYDPRFYSALKFLEYSNLIFDMVDDYLAQDYGGANLEEGTSGLIRESYLTVLTTSSLREQYCELARACAVVPNGYNSDLFGWDINKAHPEDLPECSGPIAGMVGTIFHHLDFDLMGKVAESLKSVQGILVLIGPVEETGRRGLEKLLLQENVVWLGPKEYRSIPDYVTHFDICISLFRKGRVARSVSPLKLYEYLGCGKPVLISGLESFRDDPLYRFTYDLDMMDIEDALTHCNEETQRYMNDRAELTRITASWDARFDLLKPFVEEVLTGNGPESP